MFYESFEDYLIDSRNGIARDVRYMEADELRDEVMKAYDFAAAEAIKHLESYKLLKSAVAARYGAEELRDLEAVAGKDFMAIQRALDKYYTDVKTGRKVGYSDRRT